MISNHINSLGVELECGMNYEDTKKLKDWAKLAELSNYMEIDGDGSVNVPEKDDSSLEIRFWNKDLDKVLSFLKLAYAECNASTNNTCGFHLHVKVSDFGILTYESCFSRFLRLYRKHYKLKPKYMGRLMNRYCRARILKQDFVIDQLEGRGYDEDRYCAINFRSLDKHDTIEFRIFPHQSTYIEAKSTILWFIDTIEGIFSSKHPKLYDQTLDFSESLDLQNSQNNPATQLPNHYVIKYTKLVTKKVPISNQLSAFGNIGTAKPTKSVCAAKRPIKRRTICAR